ncbi:ly6/PLAUR domain-containing protein 6 [Empidonax traillii]|uniref:ly6/PLAUR domain-containing protein 6 n=1 Tax=Empidonax traillii TaxID=164674 RepID=UPI000FFD9023|nr:ly6/PLAUR domain-containing protein 6 [Empidonax traillii]
MAPPPAPAWLLLLLLLLGLLGAHGRDFTRKDIVYLHPSTTPYPRGFKCFTCERAADNYECNRWAPDVYCPRGTRYCFSQHMMKVTGESVSVTKRCVPLEDCLSTGCTYIKHEEYKVCTSCCEGSICNLPLPKNSSDAVFTTLSPLSKAQRPSPRVLLTTLCLWLALVAQQWVTMAQLWVTTPQVAGPGS